MVKNNKEIIIQDNKREKLIIICGIKYSYSFFQLMAAGSMILNTPFVIYKNDDGHILAEKVKAVGLNKWQIIKAD